MEPTTSSFPDHALPEDLAERISARLDGELSPAEAAEVDRLLADNPVAQRFADDLRGLSRLCRSTPAPIAGGDLSASVVAEALRRQSQASVEDRPQPADLLEPEGDFGLPFGKSPQNWAWAGVAAAAAIVMFLGGRGERGGEIAPRPSVQQALAGLRQADPRLPVVNYQVTPDRLQQLRQLLAQQTVRSTTPPGELMAVSRQAGVSLQPADPSELAPEGVTEEVLAVNADEAELNRLLRQFDQRQEGSAVRVDGSAPAEPSLGGLWRVQMAPDGGAAPSPQASPQQAKRRRIVVLRIRIQPKP